VEATSLPLRPVPAAASAMAGSTKGELQQTEHAHAHALDPRRRKLCEREREAAMLVASGVPAQPGGNSVSASGAHAREAAWTL